MFLLFCKLLTKNCSHDHINSLQNDIKTVYKIIKYKIIYINKGTLADLQIKVPSEKFLIEKIQHKLIHSYSL